MNLEIVSEAQFSLGMVSRVRGSGRWRVHQYNREVDKYGKKPQLEEREINSAEEDQTESVGRKREGYAFIRPEDQKLSPEDG